MQFIQCSVAHFLLFSEQIAVSLKRPCSLKPLDIALTGKGPQRERFEVAHSAICSLLHSLFESEVCLVKYLKPLGLAYSLYGQLVRHSNCTFTKGYSNYLLKCLRYWFFFSYRKYFILFVAITDESTWMPCSFSQFIRFGFSLPLRIGSPHSHYLSIESVLFLQPNEYYLVNLSWEFLFLPVLLQPTILKWVLKCRSWYCISFPSRLKSYWQINQKCLFQFLSDHLAMSQEHNQRIPMRSES